MYDRPYKAVLTGKCGCPRVGHLLGGGGAVGARGSLARQLEEEEEDCLTLP